MTNIEGDSGIEFMGLIESHISDGWEERLHGDVARYEVLGEAGFPPVDEVRLTRGDEGVNEDVDEIGQPNDTVAYVVGLSFKDVEILNATYMNGGFIIYDSSDDAIMFESKAEAFSIGIARQVKSLFEAKRLILKQKPIEEA